MITKKDLLSGADGVGGTERTLPANTNEDLRPESKGTVE